MEEAHPVRACEQITSRQAVDFDEARRMAFCLFDAMDFLRRRCWFEGDCSLISPDLSAVRTKISGMLMPQHLAR